jgi:tetratricopeptide (TPR) repeat protein
MNAPMAGATKATCFVVMGFGKKTDFETGRTLDLDKSYLNMIKPAVEDAGLNCVRADEIVHSGVIDKPMYEQILQADVVVADISTSNKNALYELGIRHALRPYTTVVIGEDSIKTFPFDLSHVIVRQYHHLGEDIGVSEAKRFREELTKALLEIIKKDPREDDSPVYTVLTDLKPPAVRTKTGGVLLPTASPAAEVHSVLIAQVNEAQKRGDFLTAKALLTSIRAAMTDSQPAEQGFVSTEEPYIIQRLALVTYKSKHPTEVDALTEAKALLVRLNPETSNDTETLGLWGAVHKRLWDISKATSDLDEAIRSYERGFYLRNDYYNGINLAYLLNVRAGILQSLAEAITDFIQAERVRREVIMICEKAHPATPEETYWVRATSAEAYFGIGDNAQGERLLKEARDVAPAAWMKASTNEQIQRLQALRANSPLQYITER